MKLSAPFPWFGGKRRIAPLFWSRVGNVRNFVDPFWGSGAVPLARQACLADLGIRWQPGDTIETGNDLDPYLANFWRAVDADPEQVAAFADYPVSEPDLHARHQWLVDRAGFRELMFTDPDFYDPQVAGWWAWGLSQWIGSGWCDWQELHRKQGTKRPGTGNLAGVHRKRVVAGADNHGRGVHRQVPRANGFGRQGVHGAKVTQKKRPHLSGAGGGVGTHSTDRRNRLASWFLELQERLRPVRMCCGDWKRVTGPSVVLPASGQSGVLLDPPYAGESDRHEQIYASEDLDVAHDVHKWALERGDNSKLRIAFCGYEGVHNFPESWECVPWKTAGGYGGGMGGRGERNSTRERVWFSPHCLRSMEGAPLFR